MCPAEPEPFKTLCWEFGNPIKHSHLPVGVAVCVSIDDKGSENLCRKDAWLASLTPEFFPHLFSHGKKKKIGFVLKLMTTQAAYGNTVLDNIEGFFEI